MKISKTWYFLLCLSLNVESIIPPEGLIYKFYKLPCQTYSPMKRCIRERKYYKETVAMNILIIYTIYIYPEL